MPWKLAEGEGPFVIDVSADEESGHDKSHEMLSRAKLGGGGLLSGALIVRQFLPLGVEIGASGGKKA